MKNDVNAIINKLVVYAEDYLMLDALDETYTLNRLAALTGIAPQKTDADYGDATLDDLLRELKAACPDVDADAAADILLPLPHTANYYFNDEFGRNPKKAFDFIYELYSVGGDAGSIDGYTRYCTKDGARAIFLDVGGEQLKYTPKNAGAYVATLACPDFMSEDVTAREAAFAEKYKMAIAKRVGDDGEYYVCKTTALAAAKVKTKLSDGVVKTALLDYPVPALSVSGPKNSAAREAARLIKAAADAALPCVCACESGEWVTFYLVFANAPAAEEIVADTPLAACGVFRTADYSALLPVLEKGTALSSDLFAYKPVYAAIGGVKHGAKAADVLTAELVKRCKAALAAAAACEEQKATALIGEN